MKDQKSLDIKRIGTWLFASDLTLIYKRPVYQVTQGRLIIDGKETGRRLVIYLEKFVEIPLLPLMIKGILVLEETVYYLPCSELESLKGCFGLPIETQDSRLFFTIPGLKIEHFKLVDPFRECSY